MFWSLLANRYVLTFVAVVSLVIGGYVYYLRTTTTIQKLRSDNELLQIQVDFYKQVTEQMKKDAAEVAQANKEAVAAARLAEAETKKKLEVLYRENDKKKSLEKLAMKKSSLIQKLVNKATEKEFRCFESISVGAKCE